MEQSNQKQKLIQYTLKRTYLLEDCIAHLERSFDKWNIPKGYNYEMEGVPTGWKPTRLF